MDKQKFAELLAKIRAEKEAKKALLPDCSTFCHPEESCTITESGVCDVIKQQSAYLVIDKYGKQITLNNLQGEVVTRGGRNGESIVLIGAAGTGKTTSQFAVCQELVQSGRAGVLQAGDHKHLVSGTPGIIIVAFTRRAVANIKRNLPADLQNNAITVHKALEYQPVYYEVIDEVSGKQKTTMRFEATRHALRPLPQSIHTVIVEESSMLGTDLYQELRNALPHNPQWIFLGDIQQLPPVFGPAILGFKLLELPVVELTEVYRQALESPIISLAHRILSGKAIPATEFPQWKYTGQLTIHPWKKRIKDEEALHTAGQFFIAAESKGAYNPEEDMILIPFNKAFGTDELNKIIANHLAKKRRAVTHQIVAGFNKLYLSAGDKVLYDKEDATILSISPNPAYSGTPYLAASESLDYWGYDPKAQGSASTEKTASEEDVDFLLSQVAFANSGEDRVHQGSHKVTLMMNDSEQEITIDKAGDLNALLLGYCLTVHKAQGSEWRKVFFVLHQSHATMIQRELLYTAVTRAREELYIICESDSFVKGIESQRVKGDTLEEKANYFKGKLDAGFQLANVLNFLQQL